MLHLIRYKNLEFDISKPIHISLALGDRMPQVNCYHAPNFSSEPVVLGTFIGDIRQGGPVNYRNVHLNPHGNGTHTECLSHIIDIGLSVHESLKDSFCLAQLITVKPQLGNNGDLFIDKVQLGTLWTEAEALIIRTIPNDDLKCTRQYSGTNPPYLDAEIGHLLCKLGIRHLLIDLPSVDREEDGGALLCHRAFWGIPESPRLDSTITELIYVPENVQDGTYLLNLQIAPFLIDAAPSRPVLFALSKN